MPYFLTACVLIENIIHTHMKLLTTVDSAQESDKQK